MQLKVWRTYTNKIVVERGDERYTLTPTFDQPQQREIADEIARGIYLMLCWMLRAPESVFSAFQDDRLIGIINAPEEGSSTGASCPNP